MGYWFFVNFPPLLLLLRQGIAPLRVFSVSSEILFLGMGVSKPLVGSKVIMIRNMASQKSVWLAVVEGDS